ncbi:MAG: ABC transporter permease, partial [Clostridia bacterium]|nr:ABC transporter permease [Clostridia bacterium]
ENQDYRFMSAPGQNFGSILQAQAVLATTTNKTFFNWQSEKYGVIKEGDDFYRITKPDGSDLGIAFKDIVKTSVEGAKLSYDFTLEALRAYCNGTPSFTADGKVYNVDEGGGITENGADVAFVSRYVVQAISSDVFLSRQFQEELVAELNAGAKEFKFTDVDGVESTYIIEFKPSVNQWVIRQGTETRVYDTYAFPSKEHWLGTDRHGMDMLTRLMYGGRISLVIGIIVEAIATFLGMIMGGLAGYFGKWVDQLIMRIVDIFYCIPSTPILIILGAAMDALNVDPKIRMLWLMLILGFLGWPGMARLIRGQILSLREQEFMTATEAGGISVSRRIFKHLIPNVIPQIIVSVTMGMGGTIITEASLSFLGLGVKFPFASWGNIINDVNNTYVLQNYWFIWIPAGALLLLTVLAFYLVGDGLRDAFDPKMKR